MRPDQRRGMWIFFGILVVLHFSLRIGFGLGQLAPDLLVVALLLVARQMRAGSAAGLGLVLGILEGSVVPLALGGSAVVLTIVGYLGARSRELSESDSPIFLLVYLFIGKWIFDALLYFVTGSLFRPGIASELLLISPMAALYAAFAGLLTLGIYRTVA